MELKRKCKTNTDRQTHTHKHTHHKKTTHTHKKKKTNLHTQKKKQKQKTPKHSHYTVIFTRTFHRCHRVAALLNSRLRCLLRGHLRWCARFLYSCFQCTTKVFFAIQTPGILSSSRVLVHRRHEQRPGWLEGRHTAYKTGSTCCFVTIGRKYLLFCNHLCFEPWIKTIPPFLHVLTASRSDFRPTPRETLSRRPIRHWTRPNHTPDPPKQTLDTPRSEIDSAAPDFGPTSKGTGLIPGTHVDPYPLDFGPALIRHWTNPHQTLDAFLSASLQTRPYHSLDPPPFIFLLLCPYGTCSSLSMASEKYMHKHDNFATVRTQIES